jgi:hypothetical protein
MCSSSHSFRTNISCSLPPALPTLRAPRALAHPPAPARSGVIACGGTDSTVVVDFCGDVGVGVGVDLDGDGDVDWDDNL